MPIKKNKTEAFSYLKTLVKYKIIQIPKMWKQIEISHQNRIWRIFGNGGDKLEEGYLVTQVYGFLLQVDEEGNQNFFNKIWRFLIPFKVKGFVWEVAHNRLQTMDNLSKRRIVPNGTNMNYVFCNLVQENVAHILFECNFALEVGEDVMCGVERTKLRLT